MPLKNSPIFQTHVDFKIISPSLSPKAQEKTLAFYLPNRPVVCFDSNIFNLHGVLVRALSAVRAHVDLEGILVRRLSDVHHS